MTITGARGAAAHRVLAVLAGGWVALSLAVGPATAEPKIERSEKVGVGLYQIVASPAQKLVYVASIGRRGGPETAQILAIDPATLAVKSRIDVSGAAAFGLGLNDRTGTLYTSNTRDGSVSAIDVKAGKILATIKHGEKAHLREVLVDDQANRVYVSAVGFPERPARNNRPAMAAQPGSIWVIDGATNTLAHVIENPGQGVTGLALDRAANRLYATDLSRNEVLVIDLDRRETVARYPSGGEAPINLDIDPASGRLFVVNQKSGTLAVLDARDGKLLKSIETGAGALDVKVSPRLGQVYVSNRQAGTVSVIDMAKLEPVASLETGTLPQTIAIDEAAGLVYVTNKARGLPRGASRDTPPPEDPNGDTVTLIRP